MSNNTIEINPEESSLNLQAFLVMLAAMMLGLFLALLVLPRWVPGMAYSLAGDAPRAYWFLARGSAFASISLLWISMALGLTITNKIARLWPGAPAAFAIHEYVNLLGMAFAIFHALVLLGDRYIGFSLVQLLVPFSTASYRPLWVGLGQLGFYLWVMVTLSFYIRKGIGQKTWRLVHYASFLVYIMGISHGLFSGTDSSAGWAQKYYWITAGSLLFLFVYRMLATFMERLFPQKPRAAARPAGSAGSTIRSVAPAARTAHTAAANSIQPGPGSKSSPN
jgi:predicted ferric reductase